MLRFFRYFWSEIHPSWCLYASFCGVISGIVLTVASGKIFFQHWLWVVAAVLIIYYCLRCSRRGTLLWALIAGLVIGNFRLASEFSGQEFLTSMIVRNITISGVINNDPETTAGQTTLNLSHLEFATTQENYAIAGTLYVKLSTNVSLERSDIVTLQGTLAAGFGTYVGTMYRPELLELRRADTGDIFARVKQGFAKIVRNFIPSPAVELGLGYLVGLKSGLPEELSDTLRAVGMTHVIVASGAHLGILVGAARKVFGKLSKFSGLLGAGLLIAGFVLIVGFTPSMTRAALVSSLSLCFGYVGRKFTPLRLLIFVAMLTLLFSPLNCLNLGWQLSFASFFALLIVAPRLQKLFYGGKKLPWLAGMLLTSLATTLTCAPILIYNFGTLSLLSFVANLFILPTLPYAMLLVFLTGATSFWPWLAGIFGKLATLLLEAHIWLVNFLGGKKMFIFELPAGDGRVFLIYIILLTLLIWRPLVCFVTRSSSGLSLQAEASSSSPRVDKSSSLSTGCGMVTKQTTVHLVNKS